MHTEKYRWLSVSCMYILITSFRFFGWLRHFPCFKIATQDGCLRGARKMADRCVCRRREKAKRAWNTNPTHGLTLTYSFLLMEASKSWGRREESSWRVMKERVMGVNVLKWNALVFIFKIGCLRTFYWCAKKDTKLLFKPLFNSCIEQDRECWVPISTWK